MSARVDATIVVLDLNVGNHPEHDKVRTCAHFVLAVDPANERLVEDVARALAEADCHEDGMWSYMVLAKKALAVIAQSAGGDRG